MVARLVWLQGLDRRRAAEALGISENRVAIELLRARSWLRGGTLDRTGPGKTEQDAEDAVVAHTFETFGSFEKANHWLHRPNHVFQGRTPLEVIATDPQAVEIELTRIDHGVYI